MREWGCMSICRADQLLGLTFTHNSWHVASTFKRLTTATTHCGLIKIHQHRRTSTNPSMILIVIARSKQSTPIKLASDRQSLDFYRSY